MIHQSNDVETLDLAVKRIKCKNTLVYFSEVFKTQKDAYIKYTYNASVSKPHRQTFLPAKTLYLYFRSVSNRPMIYQFNDVETLDLAVKRKV